MSILKHSENLSNFGISLHSRIVESLVTQIEDAIANGLIRCAFHPETGRQLFSIFDFIEIILEKRNPRDAWQTLVQNGLPNCRFSDSLKFDRSNNRKGNALSPATDIAGLLYIAYMANSDFSVKLRTSSAAYFAADRRPVIAPIQAEPQIAEPLPELPDRLLNFPHSQLELQRVTGIVSRNHVTKAIKRDFIEGVDYIYHYPGYHVTDRVFRLLVKSFRSRRGTDVNALSGIVSEDSINTEPKTERMNARLICPMDSQDS